MTVTSNINNVVYGNIPSMKSILSFSFVSVHCTDNRTSEENLSRVF
jgi:hypothetical protein